MVKMFSKQWLLIFSSSFCLFLYIKCEIKNLESPIVTIKEGTVRGDIRRTVGLNTTYYAFLGIPYAEPPIRNLRFEPPVAKKPWTGTYNATRDGSQCIQGQFAVEGSEDCLFINVYVPKINCGNAKSLLPVMVWIYGGAFVSGNSSYDLYGPDYFLDENVIVVSFNYRLGIFGFLSTQDSVVPGNNALKDQVLALKWVKNNIKNFGGDPHQVTIFGESAGSVSVSYHMLSEQSKGLYRGVIMESGTALSSWTVHRNSKKVNDRLARCIGISYNNSQTFVDSLRRLNATYLQQKSFAAASIEYALDDPKSASWFGPVIEPNNKNVFFSASTYQLLSEGNFSQVPFILGFNSLEEAYFKVDTFPNNLQFLQYDVNNTKLLPHDLNVNQTQIQAATSLLKNYYFSSGSIAFSGLNLTQFLSDDMWVRPTRKYVSLTYNRVPVYFYRFAYNGNLSEVVHSKLPGAGHTAELYYLWRRTDLGNPTPQDLVIRKCMVSWWTNFAKYLNPTPKINRNVSGIIWEKSDSRYTYLDINTNSQIRQFPERQNMAIWDKLYKEFGNPPYSTY